MNKASIKNRIKHNGKSDLYHDWQNVKSALADVRRDATGRASQVFTHSLKDIKHKSKDVKDNVKHYVYEKPFKSLGIAVVTGLLIGLWMRK